MKEDKVGDAANNSNDNNREEENGHRSITVHKTKHSYDGVGWG